MKKKKNIFLAIPKIVLGTTFNCLQAKSSILFSDCKAIKLVDVPLIPSLVTKNKARDFFNIPEESFVIMFGAADINNERKGFKYLREALEVISDERIHKKIIALIPGNCSTESIVNSDTISFLYTGRLSLEDLFKAFVASDVFVSPSIADAGPMMINYSIACGTPVVAFNIGVALDLVIDGKTGYIAKMKDSFDLAKGIMKFAEMSEIELSHFRTECLNIMETLKHMPNGYDILYDYLKANLNIDFL